VENRRAEVEIVGAGLKAPSHPREQTEPFADLAKNDHDGTPTAEQHQSSADSGT
jgi:hypothetical protein